MQNRFTVFLRRETGDILRPAIIAMRELKFPMLKHSRATSIQYSITLTLCFFLGFCGISFLLRFLFFFFNK